MHVVIIISFFHLKKIPIVYRVKVKMKFI